MPFTLGIVGGMGPLASAAFLRTLYEQCAGGVEQGLPACVLLSDPSIPDRTHVVRERETEALRCRLQSSLETLRDLGVEQSVIACVTSHALLADLPASLTRGVLSLIDPIVDAVAARSDRVLMLCTDGTRVARVFERHPDWPGIAQRVILPAAEEQAIVHGWIYGLKAGGSVEPVAEAIDQAMRRHGAAAWIAGCTELHLVARHLVRERADAAGREIIDPLLILARRFADARRDAPCV